jgi:hypothetical protein
MMVETASKKAGALVMHEASPLFCRESKEVTNSTGDEVTLLVGHPLDDNALCTAANIANADGIVLEKTVIADGESALVPVLARGPAVINVDELPTTDYAASAINMTNYQTAIEALDIVVREEPDTQEEQTT